MKKREVVKKLMLYRHQYNTRSQRLLKTVRYVLENKDETVAEVKNLTSSEKMEAKIEANSKNLQKIIQLLTLKIQSHGIKQNEPKMTAENFAKVVPDFDGHSIPVEHWFSNFEQNVDAYGLSEKQKYVQARNKMTKPRNYT